MTLFEKYFALMRDLESELSTETNPVWAARLTQKIEDLGRVMWAEIEEAGEHGITLHCPSRGVVVGGGGLPNVADDVKEGENGVD